MVGVVKVSTNIKHIRAVKKVNEFVFDGGAASIVMGIEVTKYNSM